MQPSDADRRLDRYELVERIAVGGMAEVFRARAFGAHGFEKVLAIKRILPSLASDPEFEARFIAEAKIAVTLAHANVVQVLDFGRVGGSLYIAMEFLDGPDLATVLKASVERGRPLPVSAGLHIAMELARGLDFAHQRGVVHRDISPSNILLSRAGEVKITDFGIAQAAAEVAPAKSGVHRIMGKWRYMSPEQARGQRVDERSDLFSAAVVVYEVLTGHRLFPGDDAEAVVKNVCNMPIAPPSSIHRELPESLDPVLLRALERDPAKRWQKAADMLRALLEVSYERTLVATALDVREVVGELFPPGGAAVTRSDRAIGAKLIDQLIRAEMAGTDTSGAARRTASITPLGDEGGDGAEGAAAGGGGPASDAPTTGVTFVRRGTGADGVTDWEPAPESEEPGPPAHALAASSPEEEEVVEAAAGAQRPGRARPWLAIGAVAAAAAVAVTLWIGRAPERLAVPVAVDAGAAPQEAMVLLDSHPAGATVLVDGTAWPERTPTTVRVAAADQAFPHVVELRLAGHRAWVNRSVTVTAGAQVEFHVTLEPARLRLRVTSEPPGAAVDLDGTPLGDTPVNTDALDADGAEHTLHLRKRGFDDATAPVTLTDGADLLVERRLEAQQRYGKLNLFVEPWANVYFEGQLLGEAPAAGLRLPVGKQRLKLVNPVRKLQKTIVVDIPERGVATVRTTLP